MIPAMTDTLSQDILGVDEKPGASDRSGFVRAVALLSAFRTDDHELSAAELSRRTGLPRSTTHRISSELTELGLLERTSNNGYRLGMRLFELGHMALFERGLRDTAAPFLADLANATHETVHLAILNDLDVVYLDIIRPSGAPAMRSRPGGRLPATATAVGKAILAFSPSDVVERSIERGLSTFTPHTITDGARLRAELKEIRREGLAYDNQEQALGTICCAAPIFGTSNEVVGSVSVSGRAGVLRFDRVRMAVRSTAAGISRFQSPAKRFGTRRASSLNGS